VTPSAKNATIVVAILSALFLAETAWFAAHHSLTYDETAYLNLSIQSVQNRRLDPGFVALGTAPLPALLTYIVPMSFSEGDISPSQDRWERRLDAPQLIRLPRFFNSLLIGVPLVVSIFLWLRNRHGLMTATLGGGLAALSPTLVAHGALATTDASLALFGILGMAAIAWFASSPSPLRLVVCAIAIAAVMTAKYSGVFLLPVASSVFLLSSIRRHRDRARTAAFRAVFRELILHSALLALLVLPLWWAGHLFTRVTPQELSGPDGSYTSASFSPRNFLQFANTLAPVVGLRYQLEHVSGGGDAFLAGERSTSGWWYYFPLAFLFKSTPAELALAAFLLGVLVASLRRPLRSLAELDSSTQCLLLSAAAMTALLLTSRLNLGHRYMIILYPILIVVACDRLAVRLVRRRQWLVAAAGILLTVQVASSLAIAPHYLAYVNRFSGGPENGWRLLADSSLDWGQDLPSLRSYLESRGGERVALKYFGSALPAAYGVYADDFNNLRTRPESYTLFALSATFLDGLYMGGDDPFGEFRKLEPDLQMGYSIMLYDLRRPEALAAFRDALTIARH
jgi:hypothetical protein